MFPLEVECPICGAWTVGRICPVCHLGIPDHDPMPFRSVPKKPPKRQDDLSVLQQTVEWKQDHADGESEGAFRVRRKR